MYCQSCCCPLGPLREPWWREIDAIGAGLSLFGAEEEKLRYREVLKMQRAVESKMMKVNCFW